MNATKARIAGTGVYLPDRVLDNHELSAMVDTSDEWIVSRTGINERRISDLETWDMGVCAAKAALEDAEVDAAEIDLVIGVTSTPEYIVPSLSCIIQGELGMNRAICFDVGAACTGFITAADIVQQYISSGRAKKAIVISAENMSSIIDYTDRKTCILFGDGAGAAVFSGDKDHGIISSYLAADGTSAKNLIVGGIKKKNPFMRNERRYPDINEGNLFMDGNEIYKFAVRAMQEATDKLLKEAGMSVEDIDLLIPHQVNIRIIKSAAAKYNLSMDKIAVNLDRYGNTSSASIPICIDEMKKNGKLKRGDNVILVAFGGGLTYGSLLLKW